MNYHSVYDNKILRKFRGHTDVVNNISMNPSDDTFLTSSRDRTVRLWSLSQASPIGKMDLPAQTEGEPYAVFDSTGLVFGVAASMAGGQGHVSALLVALTECTMSENAPGSKLMNTNLIMS